MAEAKNDKARRSLALWRQSRHHFRLRVGLVLAAMAIPGNAYVLYCAFSEPRGTTDDIEANDPTAAKNETFTCYEDLSVWSQRLKVIQFVVEGILLSVIGGIGVLGE